MAACSGHTAVAEVLLEHGADVNAKDEVRLRWVGAGVVRWWRLWGGAAWRHSAELGGLLRADSGG